MRIYPKEKLPTCPKQEESMLFFITNCSYLRGKKPHISCSSIFFSNVS